MNYRYNKKSVASVIILSIITCGIYYLVWMAQTTDILRNQNRITRRDIYPYEVFDISGGTVVLLTIVTCGIYSIYWWYKVGKVFFNIQIREGLTYVSDNSFIYILLAIFGFSIIGMGILQNDMNNMWDYLDNIHIDGN